MDGTLQRIIDGPFARILRFILLLPYTTYECTAVIGDELVVFRVNPDGTPGSTSFDLTKCKVVGGGNVHFETGN